MGKSVELTKYCFSCGKWLTEGGFRSHNSSPIHLGSKHHCPACGGLFPNLQQLKAHEEAYANGACDDPPAASAST